jgi:thymidylate synthase
MHYRNNVEGIRAEFQQALLREEFVTDKTGVKMLEIVGANFVADQPAIFGVVNQDYVSRELDWYYSESLSVNDIPGGPPAIWKQVADSEGYINSNYGWCIFSEENNYQYRHVLKELQDNPESRRATMIYTRPEMWRDYNFDGRSDFMCTNAVQYMIRDSMLTCVVQMRSNDVVFGYKNDYAWQKHVLDKLAGDLGIIAGDIHWNVGSLHVYERHFGLIDG